MRSAEHLNVHSARTILRAVLSATPSKWPDAIRDSQSFTQESLLRDSSYDLALQVHAHNFNWGLFAFLDATIHQACLNQLVFIYPGEVKYIHQDAHDVIQSILIGEILETFFMFARDLSIYKQQLYDLFKSFKNRNLLVILATIP